MWKVLCRKVQHPNEFLPVSDVVTRVSDDGKGTYREMTTQFNLPGKPERRIIENIYCLEDIHEVLFVVIDGENEHVNAINTFPDGKRSLEFYLLNKITKKRVHWEAPTQVAHGGIVKVLQKAREL